MSASTLDTWTSTRCRFCGTPEALDARTGVSYCTWCGGSGNARPLTTFTRPPEPPNRHERRALQVRLRALITPKAKQGKP